VDAICQRDADGAQAWIVAHLQSAIDAIIGSKSEATVEVMA